jgi:hypothetical protein
MEFTKDQLKLIMRALNIYGPIIQIVDRDKWFDEGEDAKDLATEIYRQEFRL